MTSQTPCRFFNSGYCKNGANCRFAHISDSREPFTNANSNNSSTPAPTYTPDTMRRDMIDEKPLWPLSSYGAAKNAPSLLSDLDVSSEELRARAYEARKSGQLQQYMTYESEAISNAMAQYNRVMNDPKAAHQAQFLLIQKADAKPGTFGSSTIVNSAFGQPSTGFGSNTSAFGQSTSTAAFAQPTTTAFGHSTSTTPFAQSSTTSVFGQPSTGASAFGSSTSAFARPSAFAQAVAPKPAFGAPAFGQPAFGQSGFGQSTSTNPTAPSSGGFSAFASKQPAFGQSGFGSSTTAPAFGQSGFGNTSTSGGGGFSAFASTAPTSFSQAAAANPASGAFGPGTGAFAQPTGGPSAFGQSSQSTHPFGQPSQPSTNAFGQPIQPASGGFGTNTSAFGAPKPFTGFSSTASTGPSAFSSSQSAPNPFGSSTPAGNAFAASIAAAAATTTGSTAPTSGPSTNPFGLPPKPSEATVTSAFSAATSAFPQPATAFGPLAATNAFGQAPKANTFVGSLSVGPGGKVSISDPYADLLPKDYLKMLPEDIRAAFEADRFEPGKVPLWVPPIELR